MGRHQPLSIWFASLCLISLNISNRQIAEELGSNERDAQAMAELFREGIFKRRPKARMKGGRM
ncbi:MAG: hypothetical protein Q8L79_00115 [Methylobacter sp.]|uniref:hypothetical protein n=1 Tax=Methylobacter sp. TaxID=2051955 RepID=UPI0027305CB5|nr:hypothetical protein [Methylobacter sp.]MDP1663503.1 hypothetical protein [Methylobacter sp.]